MRAQRYVSYLAAEIEPKAISTLNQFERDATKVMEKIAAAGQRGTAGQARGALFGINPREVRQLGQTIDPIPRKINAVGTAARKAAADGGVMSSSFRRAGQALQIVQGPLGPLAGRLSALSDVMRTLTGFSLAGVLGAGGAFALGSIASQYQNMTDRLRPLFDDQKSLNAALSDVVGIAQRSRQALEPVVELYAKMTLAGRAAGITDKSSARIAELASKAARISGGAAASQQAGLTQFAQGFGSGSLSGDELKSIKENTLFLAKAIADGLEVPISRLKELGAEGKLTPQVIEAALLRSADMIDGAFAKLPKRIGSSLTELQNNFSVFIGQLDQSVGATQTVANGISFLANNLGVVTQAVVLFSAAMSASAVTSFAERIVNMGKAAGTSAKNTFDLARAVQTGNAVMINGAAAAQQRARYIAEGARAESAASRIAVDSAKAYRLQLQGNIGLLDKQIVAQRRALETARTLDAASRTTGGAGNSALVKAATEDLNRSLRARMLTQQQLVAVDAELVAADTRLTVATTALTAAEERLVVADVAAAASSGRLAGAKVVLQGVLTRVTAAASSLVGFLGGPWGVAFTVAAGVVTYLATQTNYAAEAARSFEGDQDGLARQLGFTTGQMQNQSAAARQLAVDLARINLLKSKEKFDEIRGSAAREIEMKAITTTTSIGDTRTFLTLARLLREGKTLSDKGYQELTRVVKKYPDLQRDPEFQQTIIGLKVGTAQFRTAIEDANKATKGFADNPVVAKPDLGAGGKPETAAQRRARLNREAAVGAAGSGLAKARAELAKAKAEGPQGEETDEAYIQRIAEMTRNVKSLADAEKGAAKAKTAGAAATARAARELESASDKADRLAGIMDRYEEDTPIKRLENLRDQAEKAKRAIDDLVGDKVEGYDGAFSQADADKLKGRIDRSVDDQARRPVTDALKEGRERLRLLDLEARGMGDLAEFESRRLDLLKQVSELYPDDLEAIRDQISEEHRLNDVLEQRNQIIENNARFLGEVRDAGRDAIRSFLGGDIKGGIKNFAKNIKNAYLDALANEISINLFGDPEKKYRDEMTRGLNDSADRLTGSSDNLDRSADSLERAAGAISSATAAAADAAAAAAAAAGGYAGAGPVAPAAGGDATGDFYDLFGGLNATLDALNDTVSQGVWDENADVVVTGRRQPKSPIGMPGGIATMIAPALQSILGSIGLKGNIGQVIGRVLGTVLGQGKQGGALSGLQGIGGLFGSSGIGQVLGGAVSGGLSGGLKGALSGALGVGGKLLGTAIGGPIGGAIGSVLGSIGGSLLGGLLGGKPPKPSSTAVVSGWNVGDIRVTSRDGGDKKAAGAAGGAVQSGLQNIIDALGGTMGAYKVSIGQYKGQWRVSPHGSSGPLNKKGGSGRGLLDFNDDYEGAVRAAILDAIQDGAIQGIRESTSRLLKAGKDLDAALEKALKFEDVFKRLKRFKDPIGAAVDDVNQEFRGLIKIFKEASATAEEWAQLEELYGLERAEAIKNATEQATSALDDFIKSLTSGPDSPLSRRTVYDNAKADVDAFRADIAAGKPVDQDKLIQALSDFQAASEELNGSRAQFYTDFADILALAQAARGNVPTAGDTTLPPSPFEGLDTTNQVLTEQLNQQVVGNGLLSQILERLSGGGGTLNQLPSSGGVSSGGTSSGGGTLWDSTLYKNMLLQY